MPPESRARSSPRAALALFAALSALAACATYHPLPLPAGADLAQGAGALKTDVSQLRVGPLKSIVLDPRSGLTPVDVAVLAVLNSPDLKAKRIALGVQAAQVFNAGLFPDPQLNTNLDQPIAGPDKATAFGASATYDLATLLQRGANRRAAEFTAKQANLDVLWAEWGTAQQARQLAVTALSNETREALLRKILRAAAERSARSQAALLRRDVTSQTAAADLAAKLDLESQLAATLQAASKARRDLNGALGLDAAVNLPLVEGAPPAPYEPQEIQAELARLPQRRPDLLALQAGYGSQNESLRKAIISQFPLTQIAFAFARDPTPTTTLGVAAVLALPIFNGHRGDVKIAEATRAQLNAEYQARLDQSQAQVKDAEATLAEADAAASRLRAQLRLLEAMLAPAPAALARGDIDSQTYLTLLQNVIGKEADLANQDLAARVAEIQLETDLFVPPRAAGPGA